MRGEMVFARVHPLVQVYALPRTGQLAHVGRIRNFRQRVTIFLASLPFMPSAMLFGMVRLRRYRGRTAGKGESGYAIGRRLLDMVLEEAGEVDALLPSADAAPGSASVRGAHTRERAGRKGNSRGD